MDLFHRATVALRNTPADSGLLDYVAMIAGTAGSESRLQFIHVLSEDDSSRAHRDRPQDEAEVLEQVESAVTERLRTREMVSCHVLTGPRLDKLLEFVADSESDLVVIGHGRERRGRRSLGRRLAMKAPCSLWMVPDGSPPVISGVIAGVDFSMPSAHAISFATLLASRVGIPHCTAVYVHAPNVLSPDDTVRKIVIKEGEKAFERFLEPLELHGVAVRHRIEESGSVASAIQRVAVEEDANLIVMGTRGLSSSSAVLLGSESEQMLSETDRPVLITKHAGERVGLLEVLLDREFHPKEEPRFG